MINPDWYFNIAASDYAHPGLIAKYEQIVNIAQDILDYKLTVRQAARGIVLVSLQYRGE